MSDVSDNSMVRVVESLQAGAALRCFIGILALRYSIMLHYTVSAEVSGRADSRDH